jgi:hypothetical protein
LITLLQSTASQSNEEVTHQTQSNELFHVLEPHQPT